MDLDQKCFILLKQCFSTWVYFLIRYGREDEELMGLRFCNEVVIAAEQIYPTPLEVACGSASKPLVNDQVKFIGNSEL
jgi:hypothetical protein